MEGNAEVAESVYPGRRPATGKFGIGDPIRYPNDGRGDGVDGLIRKGLRQGVMRPSGSLGLERQGNLHEKVDRDTSEKGMVW